MGHLLAGAALTILVTAYSRAGLGGAVAALFGIAVLAVLAGGLLFGGPWILSKVWKQEPAVEAGPPSLVTPALDRRETLSKLPENRRRFVSERAAQITAALDSGDCFGALVVARAAEQVAALDAERSLWTEVRERLWSHPACSSANSN